MNRIATLFFGCTLLVGCADLTAPSTKSESAAPAPTAARPDPLPTPTVEDGVRRAPPERNQGLQRIRASHVLIAYQGATRATATRSKDDAEKIAGQVLARINGGLDFAKAARDFSDDPTAKTTGGDLGAFDRHTMAPAFTNAAFQLDVGQISTVVETNFGFHIIKRTE